MFSDNHRQSVLDQSKKEFNLTTCLCKIESHVCVYTLYALQTSFASHPLLKQSLLRWFKYLCIHMHNRLQLYDHSFAPHYKLYVLTSFLTSPCLCKIESPNPMFVSVHCTLHLPPAHSPNNRYCVFEH